MGFHVYTLTYTLRLGLNDSCHLSYNRATHTSTWGAVTLVLQEEEEELFIRIHRTLQSSCICRYVRVPEAAANL